MAAGRLVRAPAWWLWALLTPLALGAGIDLRTCIDNFNVHRDKIIRTQDSQLMGAKFLNEVDLGAREECLRLCCETEDCDVFVFEEKNSGSCYLFHCGPPKDFKCKFTHHVNYSSAILSVNRYLPDLESQIKLTKHEQDLTKLRKPEVETEGLRPEVVRTTPSTSTTTVITKEVIPMLGQKAEEASQEIHHQAPPKCSRFQFSCRSTGECIAIYNACDGIAQCADGSDEAPELGCPASPVADVQSAVAPARQAPPRPELDTPIRMEGEGPKAEEGGAKNDISDNEIGSRERQVQEIAVVQQPAPVVYDNTNIPQQHYDDRYPKLPPAPQYHPVPPQEQHQIIQVPVQQETDFVRPPADISRNALNPRVPYDSRYLPQTQQQSWVPHQTNQMPNLPQLPTYQDKSGRVYGRTKEPDQDLSQLQYPEGVNYPKMPSYYGDNYRQPIQQENWPMPAEDARYNNQVPRYPQENLQIIPPGPDPSRKEQSAYKLTTVAQQPQPVNINKASDTGINPKHVQEKLAHDLKHSKITMEHGEHSAGSNSKKIKSEEHHQEHHAKYPDVVAYKIAGSEDGVAKIPRGAVLALTVGVIVASVMAIIIGCRIKVGRRHRKGEKLYALDADFLVNGMYL